MLKSLIAEGLDLKKRPLLYYGAGAFCRKLLEIRDYLGICPDYLVDRQPSLWGKRIYGIEIISPVQMQKFDSDCPIIISTAFSTSAEKSLKEYGFHNLWRFPNYFFDTNFGLESGEIDKLLAENSEVLSFVKKNLADKRSVDVFTGIMDRRQNNSPCFKGIYDNDTYFIEDIIRLGEHEVFVDGGGFDGATSVKFIDKVNRLYEHVYVFEPAPEMFCHIIKNLRLVTEKDRVTVCNKAIDDAPKTVKMSFLGQGSSITHDGDTEVQAVSIDHYFRDKPPPTFIKLDIEGSEMQALRGADRIIREFSPKLAVCAYHRFGDFWEIPNYLIKTYPFYHVFIRHHGYEKFETVCYAVPAQTRLYPHAI